MTIETFALPADCNREAAQSLRKELAEAIAGEVCINAAAVERIGQPMLQVLLAARMHNPATTIGDPSQGIREAARLAGVEGHLLGEQAS